MSRAVDELRSCGVARLDPLPAQALIEARAFLKSRPVYPGCHVRHGAGKPGSWDLFKSRDVVCHHEHDVLLAPHLLELALSLTDIAAEFLEAETPRLYSCNAFWTRPGIGTRPDIQEFHRDMDDARFLPLFIFLTDVGNDAAQEVWLPGRHPERVTGPAGTVFFSDTSQPHRGLRPQHGERGIAWFRWGVSEVPPSYVWDELQPMSKWLLGTRYPADPRLQRSISLLAR